MVYISIVEDDTVFADILRRYLIQYQREAGTEFRISYYQSGTDFLEHYSMETDIVLMDIEMPVMDGLKTARAMRKLDTQAVLIFITNLAQYAIQGYEVNALDYILKPIYYPHLAIKLDKAIRNLPVREDLYSIQTKEGLVRIAYSRIFYVESRDHLALFHAAEGVFQSRTTLTSLEQVMRSHGFSRPNNSFLVNLNHVQTVRNNQVIVHSKEFTIGRSRRISFMNDLSAYLGRTVHL